MRLLIKTFLVLVTTFSAASVFAQASTMQNQKPKLTKVKLQKGVHMTFDKETLDLGKMKKGDKRTFEYTFTNTGTETIEIEIVSGCDCTTLDWTRKPIKPLEKGVINVIFDSKEKDKAEKSVDVDIYLKNKDPKTNSQIMKILNYTFDLIQ